MEQKNIFYEILHWTWGILQTLVGFVVYLLNYRQKHVEISNTVITEIPGNWGGICLGKYAFVDSMPDGNSAYEDIQIRHEYGHSIQSLILGPFWIFVIGLPSLIWAGCFEQYRKNKNISYYSFYTEKWADKLANINRGGKNNG